MSYALALSALADERRRTILELLRDRPRNVGELTRELQVSQPAVSQHLRILREAGLVRVQRAGARRINHLDPRGLESLRDYVASFWDVALETFRTSFPEATNQEGRA